MMVRILVAEDHEVMRRGLRDLLLEHQGWEVCAEARNGRDALDLAVQLHPDVAVVDIAMPLLNGLQATRHIRKQSPDTEVLIFTQYESGQYVQEALRAGAHGYILKSDAALHLTEAVEALARHEPFFSPSISKTILSTFFNTEEQKRDEEALSTLTVREHEVMLMLAQGKKNRDVADALIIAPNTVITYRAKIMKKLGVSSIAGLILFAARNKLIVF
ncbi:MAG TPA: response regulator transcription factor [Ktedonobacterales bacterium]|nr:response regulator transcription factor [Ktedonobacterales bacterium]